MKIPDSVKNRIEYYCAKLKDREKLALLYKNCYPNTLETTLSQNPDGSYFVLTGDIPAMWLRDSTAQVSHYLPLADDEEVNKILKGVIKTQFRYILKDPYANAFNQQGNSHGHIKDIPKNDPWVWERKYEIDSLCYPIRLIYLFWKKTSDESIFNDVDFTSVCKTIVDLWRTEQRHFEHSPYRFTRLGCRWSDTLHNNGMGMPVSYTGMTWSGFRPSDDACVFGYLIPSNMFACVALDYIYEIFNKYYADDADFISQVTSLRQEIEYGISTYGIYYHPVYGKIYACETDGMGNKRIFDDANVPSLLSAPYLGYCKKDDPMYMRTRRFILSDDNPYYYNGKFAHGVGSPHTPHGYIWHIALSMQGLTSDDPDEIREILDMLESTDAGTGYMHEGFCADDPYKFTREWFAWSNSLFAEFVEYAVDNDII